MVVRTYYARVPGLPPQDELIGLWIRSWQRAGWETRIITPLQREQAFAEFDRRMRRFSSTNPVGYDIACWDRWISMLIDSRGDGGGLLTDYDVMNRGNWKPTKDDLARMIMESKKPTEEMEVLSLDRGGVPCAVAATTKGLAELCRRFEDLPPRSGHFSDMLAFQELKVPSVPICVEFGDTEWETAPMVHFATGRTGANAKARKIREAGFQ